MHLAARRHLKARLLPRDAPRVVIGRPCLAEPSHIALAPQGERPLGSRPLQRRGVASLHQHLGQLLDRELGRGGKRGLLGVKAHAVIYLRVGAHADGAYRL